MRMNQVAWLGLAFIATMFSSPLIAQNLLTNGSFETGDYSGGDFEHIPAGASDITGWTVGGDGVDWHNDGEMQFPQDGLLVVDLNASDGDSGSISQIFSTVAGQDYSLTFYLCGPNPSSTSFPDPREVQVDVAGIQQIFSAPASPNQNLVWEQKQLNFTAAGSSTTLAFSTVVPTGFWGPTLDNVSVTAGAPVPTAPLWALVALGTVLTLLTVFSLRSAGRHSG